MDKISRRILYKCINKLAPLYLLTFSLFTGSLIIKIPILLLVGFIGIAGTFLSTFLDFVFNYEKIYKQILRDDDAKKINTLKVVTKSLIEKLDNKKSPVAKEIKAILVESCKNYALLFDKSEKNPIFLDCLMSFYDSFSYVITMTSNWLNSRNNNEKSLIFKELKCHAETISKLFDDLNEHEDVIKEQKTDTSNKITDELRQNLLVAKRVEKRLAGINQKEYSEKDFEKYSS